MCLILRYFQHLYEIKLRIVSIYAITKEFSRFLRSLFSEIHYFLDIGRAITLNKL
ncbi:hypothetical protein H1P_1820010 [Hyella patelloides LEGE 07179]|uniref:Uncharacterized protein n=1 Tax=Hyella patelloides LEGE 07179 TaxID=945734 RepID=A0A563VNQ6_9CYAN|nr:hypothetical protein H1P_1820010 [Hyella patelloides LEGE 07179]